VKKHVRYLIWASLYQVAFMKKASHHVVKESVEYAKAEHGINTAGFVNAVLRKYLREIETRRISKPGVISQTGSLSPDLMAVVYSFPQWLVQRWRKRFGHSKAELLFSHLNKPPEFALRVIEHNITKCEAITKLENLGLMVKPGKFLESALYVNRLAPLIQDELLRNKLISIQDETSQLAVHSLQLKPGSLVLDACSGLGTKASHILDLATGIRLVALDNSLSRLSFADRRSSLILGDANFAPFKGEVFDAIILDAPCSSLGIIRKHPEIKWRRRENDINHFSHKQYAMLKSVWDKLKVGGHLVYSVCSFEPEETIDVINKFKNIRKFALENPLPFLFNKEYFVSLPFETGMDGFFIARLKKL